MSELFSEITFTMVFYLHDEGCLLMDIVPLKDHKTRPILLRHYTLYLSSLSLNSKKRCGCLRSSTQSTFENEVLKPKAQLPTTTSKHDKAPIFGCAASHTIEIVFVLKMQDRSKHTHEDDSTTNNTANTGVMFAFQISVTMHR